jgi:membrane protease YdiL (CAAX protease family)
MSDTPRDLRGVWAALVFTGLWMFAAIGLQLFALVVWFATVADERGGQAWLPFLMEQLTATLDGGALPPVVMGLSLGLQFPMMLALMELTRWMITALPGPSLQVPWAEAYGLRRPAWLGLGLAGALGLTTGWLPGWLASQIREAQWFPAIDAVAIINNALTTGPVAVRVVVALAVVVGAPVVEELVFRGALWGLIARGFTPVQTWLGTSLVFAAYHLDPTQAVPLIFTALVLGWVRLQTGSLWPCILLHAVNNGLGLLGALSGESELEATLPPALGMAAITLALCALLARVSAPRQAAA